MAVPFSQRSRQPCSRARKHTHKIREDILGLGLPEGVEEKSPQNHHGQKKLRKLPPVFHFYADQKSCKNRREDQKLKQVHVFAKHLIQLALIDALNNGRKITAVKLINPEGLVGGLVPLGQGLSQIKPGGVSRILLKML